jgi:hypothetical protein
MAEFEVKIDGVNWRVEAESQGKAVELVMRELGPQSRLLTAPSVKDVTDVPVGAGSEAD